MNNEINFLKYIKSKLLVNFISALFLVVVPKLFSQYLKLADINLTTILFLAWSIISIVIIINLYQSQLYKNKLNLLMKKRPLVINIHYYISLVLSILLILLISSLVWITLMQLLMYVSIDTNVIIISQITFIANFLIDSFSSICELLFVVVYFYDFALVVLRNQIFLPK